MIELRYLLLFLLFQIVSTVQIDGQSIVDPDLLIIGRDELPINGELVTDTFFFFDEHKVAVRFGTLIDRADWSPDSIGQGSFAFGTNTRALGEASIALGNNTNAQGKESVAMGYQSNALGFRSVAIGVQCESSGTGSIALGDKTRTENSGSVALGGGTIASGFVSTAIGNFTRAIGNSSIATGHITESIGFGSTAMGFNTKALGFASTSMGNGTQINSSSGLAIGLYNDTIRSAAGGASFSDPLFIVGNGVDASNLSNAMVVRNNGTVGIGTNGGDAKLDVRGLGASNEPHLLLVDENPTVSNPRVYARLSDNASLATSHYWEFNTLAKPGNDHANAKWNFFYAGSGKNILQLQGNGNVFLDGNIAVTSDRRLKSNIRSVSDRASDLLQLGGYSYNRSSSEAYEIGLIAQEVEEYFPELVIENDEGYKTVNYDGLIPVLIEALKAEKEKHKELEMRFSKLEEAVFND